MRSRYSAAPRTRSVSDAAIEGKLGWVTESTEAQAEFTESNSLARIRRPRLCNVARDTSAACPVWNATRRIRIRGGPLRLQQALA